MCIIAVKPAGIELPDRLTMEECWDSNPDGAGYMYPAGDNEWVKIRKGFMGFESFYKAITADHQRLGKKVPMVFHCRIGTSGTKGPECTHPFPITHQFDDMKYAECSARRAAAHNGVLSLSPANKQVNDTMTFIRLIDKLNLFDKIGDELWKELFEMSTQGSKFAFMVPSGEITMTGSGWITDKSSGMIYSNDSYVIPRVTSRYTKLSNTSVMGLDDESNWAGWQQTEGGLWERGERRVLSECFCPKCKGAIEEWSSGVTTCSLCGKYYSEEKMSQIEDWLAGIVYGAVCPKCSEFELTASWDKKGEFLLGFDCLHCDGFHTVKEIEERYGTWDDECSPYSTVGKSIAGRGELLSGL